MKRHYSISHIASVTAIVCYLIFAVLASSRYPLPFSPMTNWLSQLGSADLNPDGAIFYNIGIFTTGLALIPFFLGLSSWKIGGNQPQNILILTTQGFGVLGVLAMILSAIFPINFADIHGFFSVALYILLGTAFGLSVAALRYHPACPKWLLALGALVALVDIFSGIFHSVYALEWITVALFLCYVGFLGFETGRLTLGKLTLAPPAAGHTA